MTHRIALAATLENFIDFPLFSPPDCIELLTLEFGYLPIFFLPIQLFSGKGLPHLPDNLAKPHFFTFNNFLELLHLLLDHLITGSFAPGTTLPYVRDSGNREEFAVFQIVCAKFCE